MSVVADCTVSEMILLSAVALEDQGRTPFTAEELTVAAWQRFPRAFGLRGFVEQHPDTNKVLTSLMGEKGMVRRGWLAKMGQKLYALTRKGRDQAERLSVEPAAAPLVLPATPVAPREEKLPRELEQFLLGLLESSAVFKFREERQSEWTFADACRFWGITENLSGSALDARLAAFESTIADVKRRMGRDRVLLSTRRSVAPEEVAELSQIHTFLEKRFERHLNLLRSRNGRR